jgi:hypothetical protein
VLMILFAFSQEIFMKELISTLYDISKSEQLLLFWFLSLPIQITPSIFVEFCNIVISLTE